MRFAGVSVPGRPDKFFTSPLPSSEHFPVVLSSCASEGCSRQRGANDELSVRTDADGGVEISLCTGVLELIVALDAAPELYTVLYTIVGCGGAFSFQGSTSAIMSLTAFAVKSFVSQK